MNRLIAFCVGLACVLSSLSGALADTVVIRAGKIMPVSNALPWVIENGEMIMRDGTIVAIGTDLEVPRSARIINLPDATVVPGFVSANSFFSGLHSGPESISGAYSALDGFDLYGDYRPVLSGGVTTVHISPGVHRLVAGRGAVVRLGGPADSRVLVDNADLAITLGPEAWNPPDLVEMLVPPSSENTIQPSTPQRPDSRIGQYLAIRDAIHAALNGDESIHLRSLAEMWSSKAPLRIYAQRSVDLLGAINFLSSNSRPGYIVGGAHAARVATQLRDAGIPLVYTVDAGLASPRQNLGDDDEQLEQDLRVLSKLDGLKLALSVMPGRGVEDLRLLAAIAQRGGIGERRALEAITRTSAEVIGVDDRVGSLDVGKDADFVILSGHPLETSSHVLRVYTQGHLVFKADHASTVIRGATVWLGPDNYMDDASILIEDGRITAVGRRVPHPPHASVIDAKGAFITPGFIDAFGHLGFEGDQSSLSPSVSPADLVGPPDDAAMRVARHGVTTVMTSSYRASGSGSQVAAVRTAGESREQRVVRRTAAVVWDFSGNDAPDIGRQITGRLGSGKAYVQKWEKYTKELAEWEAKKEAGTLEPTESKVEEEEAGGDAKPDPLTGTWSFRVFGGPIPPNDEPEGKVAFKLTGDKFEARIIEPPIEVEHKVVGTLDGNKLSGRVEVDTRGMGFPSFEAEIDEEDHAKGTISLQGILTVEFEMERTDKSAVEFKVARRKRRTTGKDGRPLPPRIDEALEPVRAVLEKRIPVVIRVKTAHQIDAVLDALGEKSEIRFILLDGDDAEIHASRLAGASGVIVPRPVVRNKDFQPYLQADVLARAGVSIAFQSGTEDGARSLPTVALYAVNRGLNAESALAALTIDAAKLYGLESSIGSIAPGRDADLLIFSGHPFDASSSLDRVFIGGEEVSR